VTPWTVRQVAYLAAVITIADRTTLLDLYYLGSPGHIATCVLETSDGLALVDSGPTTTIARLEKGVAAFGATLEDVRLLLVTHIHLDHSGAAGVLAKRLPRLKVHVHEQGAKHLIDPEKLLRSATMIYGDEMERLWGEVLPVPDDQLRVLTGGERLDLGGRVVRVAYTPGHARHHVAYYDEQSGIAFTGDVLGEQPFGSTMAIPVTPPPDIDVEEMLASADRILEWRPERLFVTHFGPVADPTGYASEHAERLLDWSGRVRDSLSQPGTDEDRAAAVADAIMPEITALLPPKAADYIPRETLLGNWVGLARYWRKRDSA
jgi:glyoxylase-like metal-dependent hydrolase (beta-lactamase superfamily II)